MRFKEGDIVVESKGGTYLIKIAYVKPQVVTGHHIYWAQSLSTGYEKVIAEELDPGLKKVFEVTPSTSWRKAAQALGVETKPSRKRRPRVPPEPLEWIIPWRPSREVDWALNLLEKRGLGVHLLLVCPSWWLVEFLEEGVSPEDIGKLENIYQSIGVSRYGFGLFTIMDIIRLRALGREDELDFLNEGFDEMYTILRKYDQRVMES